MKTTTPISEDGTLKASSGFSTGLSSYLTLSTRTLDVLYVCACIAIAIFAFAINWQSGNRGIFFLDQSMVFDGGWRILQGQVPYKDWSIPFGPVTFYIQALFFRIFGVTWSATVLSACTLNVLAALSVMRITRLLLGRNSRLLACCSGFVTAVCFQAPFGTLWLEQSSMFFDLLGLQAVAESLQRSGKTRRLWQAAAGVLLAIACLAKQNFGVFFSPILLGLLLAGEIPNFKSALKSLCAFVGGLTGAGAGFVAWLWCFSDLSEFVYRTIVVAGQIGRARLIPRDLGMNLLFGILPLQLQPPYLQVESIAKIAGVIGILVALYNLRTSVWQYLAPVSICALLIPIFQGFVQITTFNEWQNNVAFTGLALVIGVGVIFRLTDCVKLNHTVADGNNLRLPSPGTVRLFISIVASLWGAVFLWYEFRAVQHRYIQQFSIHTEFRETVKATGLETLHWGEPTKVGGLLGDVVKKKDFEDLIQYLKTHEHPFFVMGDTTILYGLLGRRSPQPLLYFQPNHSFLTTETSVLDQRITKALLSNDVRIVVREKKTFLVDNQRSFQTFPSLLNWFTTGFDHVADFGNYEVWERKPAQ